MEKMIDVRKSSAIFSWGVLLLLALHNDSLAQLTTYRVEPMTKALVLLTGTTTQIFGPNTSWQMSQPINLPFAFIYVNRAYSKIKVSSNGFLTFDSTESYHYLTNDLQAKSPKHVLAPLWDYLKVGSSGRVHYAVVGSAPSRIFVVEFYRVVWGPFSSPVVDFQVRLCEGSNDIEFHYGAMANAGFGADGASIGIKDDQGNFINATDGSRDIAQNKILVAPLMNFRFTTSPPPPKDLGVVSIIVKSTWFVARPDTVSVIVENKGSESQTGFVVAYQVGGGAIVRETFGNSLPPASKAKMTFSTLWKPNSGGLYFIRAWTELNGDMIALNDSARGVNTITVYDLELPVPVNLRAMRADQGAVLNWERGRSLRPLPGEWNGKTSENLNVHMILDYNSTGVDTCEIYYMVSGRQFSFPLKTLAKVPIRNNAFSFYYSDQYGRMSTDVAGTFRPPDSCEGTWRSGVYVNNVYTVFAGTWKATAMFKPPVPLGYRVFRDTKSGVQPVEANLRAVISDPNTTSWLDAGTGSSVPYYYVVVGAFDCGCSAPSSEASISVSGLVEDATSVPEKFLLRQPYPNPFNPATNIVFDVPHRSSVSLKVYDLCGRDVTTLVSSDFEPGRYKATWNAANMSSGMYLCRMTAGDFVMTKKLILLK
jgi:hypothetical protein